MMQTFAQQLNAMRKERGLTQEQLAQELNVSRTTVSRWESGKVLPDIETIKRLSQVLNYNFFTVEGLTEETPAPAEAPAAKKSGKTRWILAGAAGILAICLILVFTLTGRAAPAQIVAASSAEKAYLQFGQDGGLRWDVVFSFENTGGSAFTPDGVDFTCFENEEAVFEMTVPPEELIQYMGGSTLEPGGKLLEIPFGANMLNLTSTVCRIYGKDEQGNPHEAAASVELVCQTWLAAQSEKQSGEADADAACVVATADKEVAYLEPFFDDGFGWNINFYFENTSPVAFVPDGVETICYVNDTVAMTFSTPYEDLRPHMSNGLLFKGGIPLHYPVGVNLLEMTHVYCHVFGTDEKGNPVDVGMTVPLSQEYLGSSGQ